jgi:hypothetical protein
MPGWTPGSQPFCVGGWSWCVDGLVGLMSMGLGFGIIVVGVVLAVKNPVEKTVGTGAEAAGSALSLFGPETGGPEIAMAGRSLKNRGTANTANAQMRRAVRRRNAQARSAQQAAQRQAGQAVSDQESARQTREATFRRQAEQRERRERAADTRERTEMYRRRSQTGAGSAVGEGVGASQAERPLSRGRMSVQEQETYRDMMGAGYSSVQARRRARGAGSHGTRQERARRALQQR